MRHHAGHQSDTTTLFQLPEAPRLLLRHFNKSTMSLTEVRGNPASPLTTNIPPADEYLVQLRLIECQEIDYFSEGRHLEGIDARAGAIQFHDLRREPVAVIRSPFHVLHVRLPLTAINAVAEQMYAPRIDDLRLSPSQSVEDPLLRNLFLSLLPTLTHPAEASSLAVDYVAQAIVAHVTQTYAGVRERKERFRGGLSAWQERRSRDLLAASLASDISLGRLAEECGLSTRHFARAFQETFGVPPHRYLLKQRVGRAKQLLEDTSKSLLEIALECGFSDQSHFTRIFRACMGTTPGAWRRLRGSH